MKTFAGHCMKCQSEFDTYGDTMIKHLTVLVALLMTIGSQVSAFDYAHLQKLKDTNECVVVEAI